MLRVLLALGLVLAALPVAAAAPPCVAENAGGQDQPLYLVAGGTSASVWEETNGVPGLQTATCSAGGVDRPADTRTTTVSVPPVPNCVNIAALGLRLCVL